jgi:regulator of sigma E protease
VTVHEYGHFWVARKFGVKVLRFSVGFGKPIWQWTDKQGTEFAIAWIPLGGYVKMLDEREGEVPENELNQAFTQKKPYQKISIALAGPLANFIFAIVAFTLMYSFGVRELVPLVDDPIESSVAYEAGMQRGDKILSIDGTSVGSFADVGIALASRVGESGAISIEIDRQGLRKTLMLPIQDWLATEQSPDPLRNLGIYPKMPIQPAIVGEVVLGGAASLAGLEREDVVLEADGVEIADWMSWVDVIRAKPDQSIALVIDRKGVVIDKIITPEQREMEDGSIIGYVGVGTVPQPWPDDQLVVSRIWPWQAFARGVSDTGRMIGLSYDMLSKMVTGKVSLKQIGGPISMARMAGMSVESGFEAFVSFLALISISLGIVNLLPVPVLDGGHVVIHAFEWIQGKPLSERAQIIGMQVGLAFIVMLMGLAFFNDIGRIM